MSRKSLKKKMLTALTAISAVAVISMAGPAYAGGNSSHATTNNDAYVSGNADPADWTVSFYNQIDGSFNSASGISQVQQNNGANNVMQQGVTTLSNGFSSNYASSSASSRADIDHPFSATSGLLIPRYTYTYYTYTPDNEADTSAAGTGDEAGDNDDYTPHTVTVYALVYSRSTNDLTSSFNGAAGENNAQQNNGNNNAMQQGDTILSANGAGDTDSSARSRASVWGGENMNFLAAFDNNMNNSFNSAAGISNAQQNNGSNNAMQQDVNLAAVSNAVANEYYYWESEYESVDLGNVASNHASVGGNSDFTFASYETNTLTNSFDSASGINNAQQNNGSNNVMQQSVSEASVTGAQEPGGYYLGDSDASLNVFGGSFDSGAVLSSTSVEALSSLDNSLNGSFTGAKGVNNVEQNNGANNVMQQSVAITSTSSSVTGNFSNVRAVSMSDLDGAVSGNSSFVAFSSNTNTITNGSFNSAKGITNVQQNNGANNVIQQAVSVTSVH
jgi:hypothetical protein